MKTFLALFLFLSATYANFADEIRVKNIGNNDSHFSVFIISVDSVITSELYEFNILVSQDDYDHLWGIIESYKSIQIPYEEIMRFGSYRIDQFVDSHIVSTVKLNPELALDFFIELLCILKEYDQNSAGIIFFKGTLKRLL